jgi:predicted flap endonuclease-1-like 5' DNA nuclease
MAENAPAPSIIEPIALVDTPVEKKRSSKKAEGDKNGIAVVAAAGSSEDLTVIEGLGPKIQMLLNQYGIYTYRQLAETEVERLKEILSTAGPQLAMHDPGTWPSQANLAANDQWDTLKSVQGFLKGGKKPT